MKVKRVKLCAENFQITKIKKIKKKKKKGKVSVFVSRLAVTLLPGQGDIEEMVTAYVEL